MRESPGRHLRAFVSLGVPQDLCPELKLVVGSRLLEMLKNGGQPSVRDLPDLEQVHLRNIRNCVLVPGLRKDQVQSVLSIGEKLSGEQYDNDDKEFLATVAGQLAAAIESMLLDEWKRDAERALDIQQNLLPREIPQVAGCQISCAWQPARLV